MAKIWNGKAFIDSLADRLWDTSESFREKIIEFANEIQNEIAGELPNNYFTHKMKKLLPPEQTITDLSPQIPSKPTNTITQHPNTLNYNTGTSSDYTFDSDGVVFQASNVILNYGLLTNETLRCRYDVDGDPDASSGIASLTGSLVGAANVANNVLDIPSGSDNYVQYSGDNADWTDTGCVRFKYTPGYSGSPGTNQYMFVYADGVNDIDNFVRLMHTGTNIRWDVYNTTGTSIKTVQTGNTFNPVAGTTYEIEFNFDTTNGEYRLFIDGVNINGLKTSAAGTRTNDPSAIIRLGADYTSGANSVVATTITDIQLFNTVQHTANFTGEVPRTLPRYTTSDQKITLNTGFSIDELSQFTESAVNTANTETRYIIDDAGQEKYWDGAAWVNSNGTFAESSTAADISTNAEALLSTTAVIKVNAFLKTTDDQETPELTSVIAYDKGLLIVGTEYKATITFLVYDDDGLRFIESESSEESDSVTADFDNQSLTVNDIDIYDGDSSKSPNVIHRRIYIAKKETTDTEFSEPFFKCDIEDNTTTTLNIAIEPASTITPPSDSEVSQISPTTLSFATGSRYLARVNKSKIKRYDPNPNNKTNSPSYFDFEGPQRIYIYPILSSEANEAQRTLLYEVFRRPHEIFYEKTRKIDLPIEAEPALRRGIEYLAYNYRDRDGAVTKQNQYMAEKKKFIDKMRRQRSSPSHVSDKQGDVFGFEV